MSSYFGGVWSSLKFNSSNALYQFGSGFNYRPGAGQSSDLVFKNPRYKSVLVHIAKQLLMSELEGELAKLMPKFQRHMEGKMRDKVLQQQSENHEILIEKQECQSDDNSWGRIKTQDAGGKENGTLYAVNKYGTLIPEALMLYYHDPNDTHDIEAVRGFREAVNYNAETMQWTDAYGNVIDPKIETISGTATWCHIDLSPQVSMNTAKNLVMTQVQGRDFTRKELVSGGDYTFTVNGSVVSDEIGVYPSDAVKKLAKIMKYNGILNVKCMLFDQLGITRVIVKDFSLGTQEYKNIQPYSFTCVAIEPDEDVQILKDTIAVLNEQLELSPMNKWYKMLLENKLAQMAANAVVNTATSTVTSAAGMGLDALVPNI